MENILLDPRNARVHDSKNKAAIRESLSLGAGRSIVIDAENVVIGGNGVYAEAQSLGIPVRIIDSDGSELIAIRRTDLKTADAKRKALALADNRTSDLSNFDDEKVAEIFSELDEYASAVSFSPAEIKSILGGIPSKQQKPEVGFSEELLECHNYVVLFFDNDVDWLQAQTLFGLKTVADIPSSPRFERRGIGRVIRGADAINRIAGGR